MKTLIRLVDRSLLRSGFQGYRLHPTEHQVISLPLELPPFPSSPFYQQLSSWSDLNALTSGPDEGSLAFVNAQGQVVIVSEFHRDKNPILTPIYTLALQENVLPSLLCLDDWILICNGRSEWTLLHRERNGNWIAFQTGHISPFNQGKDSCVVHAFQISKDGSKLYAVLSQFCHSTASASKEKSNGTAFPFQLHALEIFLEQSVVPRKMFSVSGSHRPRKVFIDGEDPYELFILSECVYDSMEAGFSPGPATKQEFPSSSPTAPKYAWTQTEIDVTIHIPIAYPVKKSQVQCLFQSNSLRLKVCDELIFSSKTFDSLSPSDCFWTLENSHCVSLYLNKKNEGIRWTHLWTSDDGILETLDPSQLDAYTQSLAKYKDQPIYQPALSEKPEEEDFQGEAVRVSVFNCKGESIGQVISSGHDWIGSCLLPRHDAVCLSYDVDGLLFSIQRNTQGHLELIHRDTYPALGYVLASKRDKRLVGVSKDFAVIAESRNAFVYEKGSQECMNTRQYLLSYPSSPVQIRGGCILEDRYLVLIGTSELLLFSTH